MCIFDTMQEFNPDYFKVALSTSVVVFGFDGNQLLTLIGSKPHEPYLNAPTLPTSWVLPEEDVEEVARREMINALGEHEYYLEQLTAFAKLYRKPEGRVVNIAHYCLVHHELALKKPSEGYNWVPLAEIPQMVYDHNDIYTYAKERLKRRVKRRPIGFRLLPKEFTFNEIHTLYEQALSKELDKRNFRKKFLKSELLILLDKTVTTEGSKKPSGLYTFNEKRYEKMTLKGYDFVF